MKFSRYHALGNDYIVARPEDFKWKIDEKTIRRICHRHYGVGADGILWGPLESRQCDFGLRIFNPDGSEAEKSGNGLRIFARFLIDGSLTDRSDFTIETAGGPVVCKVRPDKRSVRVQMGGVSFNSREIPVAGGAREVINETLEIEDRRFKFCAVTVGNPHCVVLSEEPSPGLAQKWGPLIETHPLFPNRTNVQFLQVTDRSNIRIEIWERGAGYTLASGSSSTAAAAVALKLGRCDPKMTVRMPGGDIELRFDENLHATMTGPVTKVCDGVISPEIFEPE